MHLTHINLNPMNISINTLLQYLMYVEYLTPNKICMYFKRRVAGIVLKETYIE